MTSGRGSAQSYGATALSFYVEKLSIIGYRDEPFRRNELLIFREKLLVAATEQVAVSLLFPLTLSAYQTFRFLYSRKWFYR